MVAAGALASCSTTPDPQGATDAGKEFADALNKGDADALSRVAESPETNPKPVPELVKVALQKYGKKGIDVSKVQAKSDVVESASLFVPIGPKTMVWPMSWDKEDEDWKVSLDDPVVSKG